MIILDFLFYYLTIWFEQNKNNLKWSTPIERTVYAVSLITGLWIISVYELFEICIEKSFTLKHVPLIPGVIIILCIMQVYKYIYITKNRYSLVTTLIFEGSNGVKSRKIFAIIFVLFSFIFPYLLFMIFS